MGGFEAAKLTFGTAVGTRAGWGVGKAIGCLAIVVVLFVIALLFGLFSKLTTSSEATNTVIADNSTTSEKPPAYAVGQEFTIGYWSYTVNGGQWMPAIPSLGNSMEIADSAFLVLNVSARNEDRNPSMLQPFKLIDTEGREYDLSPKGEFMRNLFGVPMEIAFNSDVNPGVFETGYGCVRCSPRSNVYAGSFRGIRVWQIGSGHAGATED